MCETIRYLGEFRSGD